MTKHAYSKKDLTKKDLINILEKIDSERVKENLKESVAANKELDPMSDSFRFILGEFPENLTNGANLSR